MKASLLIELLTEELPPKALPTLAQAFAQAVQAGLAECKLAPPGVAPVWFATPRRLAVCVADVMGQGPDERITEKIMPCAIAYDAAGKPTPALLKKLAAKGIPEAAIAQFERRPDGKNESLFYSTTVRGVTLDSAIELIIDEAVRKLPVPRIMRWGAGEAQFVRPVHGLLILHGERNIPGRLWGDARLVSTGSTRGHRFMARAPLAVPTASAYESTLHDHGRVVAGFQTRRATIEHMLREAAGDTAEAVIDPALLDEVTALVEWPTVHKGEFSADFLAVPEECLVLSMTQHQKYFPLREKGGGPLQPRFLFVSNMLAADPGNIVRGNERVLRARLSDARFFFDQDRKQRLEDRVPRLANVVYHNKLGSQLERVERIQLLAGRIARRLGADHLQAERAAWLSKADLLTDMVGEFPELQGIMGRYYARYDGEDEAVAAALAEHYHPRFAGDSLPQGPIAAAVSLADKLDTLVGIFGIGLPPTGDKDPFALRRAALGVVRLLVEQKLPLALDKLIADTVDCLAGKTLQPEPLARLPVFVLDRLRSYLRDCGYAPDEIEAVLAENPMRIDLVLARVSAVREFKALPEAQSLAAANKRIRNILRQGSHTTGVVREALLAQPEEKALHAVVLQLAPRVAAHIENGNYTEALCALAAAHKPVDQFFDQVLVNAEDQSLRENRLALLSQLSALMNQVADISRLAA